MAQSSKRKHIKWELFQERKKPGAVTVMCELCGAYPASDLHEIINRSHFLPEMLDEVPRSLLALVCNHCNTTIADANTSRKKLLRRNLERYSYEVMLAEIYEFAAKCGTLKPEVTVWSLIKD